MTIDTIPTHTLRATGGYGQPVYVTKAGTFTNLEHEAESFCAAWIAQNVANSLNRMSRVTGLTFSVQTTHIPSEVTNA